MGLQKKILHFVLSICYCLVKLLPQNKKRVVLVSLTSNRLQDDFQYIYKELMNDEFIQIRSTLFKYKPTLLHAFLYFMNCIYQVFVINTAKVVVIHDNNYVISNFKMDRVKVIQIWHACGALKKFGNDIHREYKIQNYDYVISTSLKWSQIYARSFEVKEQNVLPLGMARTDVLFKEEALSSLNKQLLDKYPTWKDKRIILYAPTFRGNIVKGMSYININVDHILQQLDKDVLFVYKMHPLLGDVTLSNHERCINASNENLYALMSISSCLISDYSSIIYDYCILSKPILLFVPDIKEYEATTGLNESFYELPLTLCKKEDELVLQLKTLRKDDEIYQQMKDTYFTYQDGCSAKRIARFIHQIIVEKD